MPPYRRDPLSEWFDGVAADWLERAYRHPNTWAVTYLAPPSRTRRAQAAAELGEYDLDARLQALRVLESQNLRVRRGAPPGRPPRRRRGRYRASLEDARADHEIRLAGAAARARDHDRVFRRRDERGRAPARLETVGP